MRRHKQIGYPAKWVETVLADDGEVIQEGYMEPFYSVTVDLTPEEELETDAREREHEAFMGRKRVKRERIKELNAKLQADDPDNPITEEEMREMLRLERALADC